MAVLLPIVLGIAVSSNIKPIKLLLPLVIGATIGADVTIIGPPGNLIAKNTIEEFSNGKMTVSFFEYAKIGIPMLILTVAGMVLTDYLDFLPPMHVIACCGAVVIVLCEVQRFY